MKADCGVRRSDVEIEKQRYLVKRRLEVHRVVTHTIVHGTVVTAGFLLIGPMGIILQFVLGAALIVLGAGATEAAFRMIEDHMLTGTESPLAE